MVDLYILRLTPSFFFTFLSGPRVTSSAVAPCTVEEMVSPDNNKVASRSEGGFFIRALFYDVKFTKFRSMSFYCTSIGQIDKGCSANIV